MSVAEGWPDENGLSGLCSNIALPAAIPLCDCRICRAGALTPGLAASNAPGLHRGSLRSSPQKRHAATLRCNQFQMPPACRVDRYVCCYRPVREIVAFAPARSKERKYRLAKPVALAVVGAVQAVAPCARIHRPSLWHFRPLTHDFHRPAEAGPIMCSALRLCHRGMIEKPRQPDRPGSFRHLDFPADHN